MSKPQHYNNATMSLSRDVKGFKNPTEYEELSEAMIKKVFEDENVGWKRIAYDDRPVRGSSNNNKYV